MVLNRSLTMDVVSSNSCKNKEYILIGQIFDRTLSIFWFLNVWLQHKNGWTCPMTDHYLHHCYSSTSYSLFLPFSVLDIFKFRYDKFFIRRSASISKLEWFEQPCAACCSHWTLACILESECINQFPFLLTIGLIDLLPFIFI